MNKLICEEFSFLVDRYGFEYKYQTLDLGDGWIVSLHSFYNATGCFTIHSMDSRGELDFYRSNQFSTDKKKLRETAINIYDVEKKLWKKRGDFLGIFPNLFFWWNTKKILKTVAEIVKLSIDRDGEFFGIKV